MRRASRGRLKIVLKRTPQCPWTWRSGSGGRVQGKDLQHTATFIRFQWSIRIQRYGKACPPPQRGRGRSGRRKANPHGDTDKGMQRMTIKGTRAVSRFRWGARGPQRQRGRGEKTRIGMPWWAHRSGPHRRREGNLGEHHRGDARERGGGGGGGWEKSHHIQVCHRGNREMPMNGKMITAHQR